jgi:hypothetical protein
MTDPLVKEKRGGHCLTTPNYSELVDPTPLVCGAQDGCEHSETRIEILAPGSVHFGKEICRNCDRVLRWLPKPATIEHRRFNALHIARLLVSGGLSEWERNFLKNIAPLKKLSPRQQACLDKIYAEHLEVATR